MSFMNDINRQFQAMESDSQVKEARTKKELLGGIVTDASFERLRLTKVTISVPNGRKYNIVADDGVLICTREI
jgi:hypothetical protein